jgi:hypothetical protein
MMDEIKPIELSPQDAAFLDSRDAWDTLLDLYYSTLGVPECIMYGCEVMESSGACKHCGGPMPKPRPVAAIIGLSPLSAAYPTQRRRLNVAPKRKT